MSQKLPGDNLKWKKKTQFDEKFIKIYGNSGQECILEVYVEYPKDFYKLRNGLPFLPERTKIKKRELPCDLYNKQNQINNHAHIRTLKQTLNHGLIFKNVHKVIKFNQRAWLKPYIDINIKLRTEVITRRLNMLLEKNKDNKYLVKY